MVLYTHTNHGLGLAVIHPALYRHIAPAVTLNILLLGTRNVWNIESSQNKDDLAIAQEGIDALEAFIKEMNLPTSFAELGGEATDEILHAVADTAILTPGCAKKLSRDEIFEILCECR